MPKLMRWVLFLFTACLFLCASCCKEHCASQSLELRFIGYQLHELDSTLIRKYEPNTNFLVPIDSIYRNSFVLSTDTLLIILDDTRDRIDLSKDYQVKVRSLNKTYSITGIIVKTLSCPCGSTRFESVESYLLDGVRHSGSDIYMSK
jgi:hypothetical protein